MRATRGKEGGMCWARRMGKGRGTVPTLAENWRVLHDRRGTVEGGDGCREVVIMMMLGRKGGATARASGWRISASTRWRSFTTRMMCRWGRFCGGGGRRGGPGCDGAVMCFGNGDGWAGVRDGGAGLLRCLVQWVFVQLCPAAHNVGGVAPLASASVLLRACQMLCPGGVVIRATAKHLTSAPTARTCSTGCGVA